MRLPETCYLVENQVVFSVKETQMKITVWQKKISSYFIDKPPCNDNDENEDKKRTMIL